MALTQPMFHFDNNSFDTPMVAPGMMTENSIMLCDAPFLEGTQSLSTTADVSFRGLTADVPDDLLAMTPIHGWDTPPDSPVHESMAFDGSSMVDPLLTTKVSEFFGGEFSTKQQPAHLQTIDNDVFEWTPPASPAPCANDYSSAAESFDGDDLLQDEHDHDDASSFLGDSMGDFSDFETSSADAQLVPASPTQAQKVPKHLKLKIGKTKGMTKAQGTKRKASSSDNVERRRLKVRAEVERVERTKACENAVMALSQSKNDEDPELRRHTHNVLERKRRNDLKNSYQLLREQLPTLEDNGRAPTGQILLHAVEYITSLNDRQRALAQQLAAARREGARLRALRM